MNKPHFVIDTNILVSGLLLPDSVSANAVRLALDIGVSLISQATIEELSSVLQRKKFDNYVSLEHRLSFLERFIELSEIIVIEEKISGCRDEKDNKFLEVAINGQASAIITGDKDLLVLHPFREVSILNPSDFSVRNWQKELLTV